MPALDAKDREGALVKQKNDPKNQQGQKPTKTPDETVKRLQQKKDEGRGARGVQGSSNRKLIEKKEREVQSKR